MDDGGGAQDQYARCENGRDEDRVAEGEKAQAERNANMAVADLGGIDDGGLALPAVVKGQHAVGQDIQPAAEPAEILDADETSLDV